MRTIEVERLRHAKVATYTVFFTAGALMMSWAARIPQVRDGLGLTPGQLGLVLLSLSAGSVFALAAAGVIVDRIGSRKAVATFTVLASLGLAGTGLGYLVGTPAVAAGLFFVGVGIGTWDVSMNIQGSLVEQHLGAAIMPRFHAAYSVGTVVGALFGAAMIALSVPVTTHLVATALLTSAVNLVAVRGFLVTPTRYSMGDSLVSVVDAAAGEPKQPTTRPSRQRFSVAQAWTEPRTIFIGLFVLVIAFAEGSAIDWVGIGLIDGYDQAAVFGTLGLATFLTAMTAARWFGSVLLDRFGRVVVLRVLSAVLVAGVALFVFGGHSWVAFIGVFLWGIGASLGFPVGMSAAGDDPSKAAARVSVVAVIGYSAFLGGPPFIGFLSDHFGVLHGLLAVLALVPVSLLLVPALRREG